jgi:hypothetical protein
MTTTINASNSGGGGLVQTADASGILALQTAGTTAVTIDTSQRVGIGTTSPTNGKLVITGNSVTTAQGIRLTGDTADARFICESATLGAGILGTFSTHAQLFYTDSTERMRISSSGNVTAGGTTSYGLITSAASSGYCFGTDSVSNGADHFRFTTGGGTTTGSITRVGGTGVAYNVTSDQRLKENIQDADSASALVAALQVRQFDWKADNSHQKFGFVAQELLTIAPEAVHQPSDTEEMMGVDYSKLVPMLTKAIQEQQALITSLTARIAALEGTPA